ncbi:MAG: Ig-like domain-containing protein [Salibacteraceae bacterium]
MRNWFKYWLVAFTVVMVSCAQQRTPMGGPVDDTPPQILESNPQNEALNYKGKQIYFQFDEFVRVAAATKELVVTPPLKYPVTFKMKGKKVYVNWTDTLADETTYMFQFGEGIVDVNESNPLDSNVFVFSTGDYLDSMQFDGLVIDGFSLKPLENVWVMLYPEDIDSLPYNELPRYFAKTDKAGRYSLRYISPGEYKVFALKPVNSGYLFDQPDEEIGYLKGMYEARNPRDTNATDLPEIKLFLQEDTLQFIKENKQIQNKGLTFEFNRPVEMLQLKELSGMDISFWESTWNSFNDSVVYWFDQPLDYDSLKLEIKVEGFIDTLFLRKPSTSRKGIRRGSSEAERIVVKPSSTTKLPHFKPFWLSVSTPLAETDFSNALLIEEKDTLPMGDLVELEGNKIKLDYKWKQETKYRFFIPDSSLFDRFGTTNDTLLLNLTSTKKEDFGILKISYQLPEVEHGFIWQLQSKDGKLIKEDLVSREGVLNYEFLNTGQYKVKLIFDENDNSRWDPGNYLKDIQPENVVFYEEAIDVRSNWVTELEWILNFESDSEE